jgi:cation diffusion facilitator CzcD-associated flavoprotein CzcO
MSAEVDHDVIVVGAGFSGLYMLHELRTLGFDVTVLERGNGVGGTWFWNRYPGCRCDVPSWEYSYSFSPELQQEWVWTERFPAQPEILAYLEHVAERFDLLRDIQLDTEVTGVAFDDTARTWQVTTASGATLRSQFVILATGGLSTPKDPGIPGLDHFEGHVLRTSRWPQEPVDLRAKRVGVIGTGSSGIQVIPKLAELAEHLTVFQRTPQFTIPARNRPLADDEMASIKARYPEIRATARTTGFGLAEFSPHGVNALDVDEAERRRQFDRRWAEGGPSFLIAFDDLIVDEAANAFAAEYARERIAEMVHDPAVAAALTPSGFPLGCKRLCNDTDYYETFNRSNVTLVDLRTDPFTTCTADAVGTASGPHQLDVLVLATGFDALTGAATSIDLRGRHAARLVDAWSDGPVTYLGLMVHGFPNLFTMTGPGSPSLLSNMVTSIEMHVEWIGAAISWMREHGHTEIDVVPAAQDEWSDHVQEVSTATLFAAPSCNSYYRGDNIAGKSRRFLPYAGGVAAYQEKLDEVVGAGYDGFVFTNPAPA